MYFCEWLSGAQRSRSVCCDREKRSHQTCWLKMVMIAPLTFKYPQYKKHSESNAVQKTCRFLLTEINNTKPAPSKQPRLFAKIS